MRSTRAVDERNKGEDLGRPRKPEARAEPRIRHRWAPSRGRFAAVKASTGARARSGRNPLTFFLTVTATALVLLGGWSGTAEAQYTNQNFGFEAGYQFIEDDLGLTEHAPIFGFRAGYKAGSDHWWFTARALISFRDDILPGDRTILLFHLTPVDFRYYFLTDEIRPFLGGASAFHFLINSTTASTVQWGLGPVGGIEFKIGRNLFLGVQVDGLYMLAFDADAIETLQANMQLLFFL